MISGIGATDLPPRHCRFVRCDQKRIDETTFVAADDIGPLPWLAHQLACRVPVDDSRRRASPKRAQRKASRIHLDLTMLAHTPGRPCRIGLRAFLAWVRHAFASPSYCACRGRG